MHEASLMRALIARIEQVAAEAGGARAVRVRVWAGALSHFTREHLAEHFRLAAIGTLAEGAGLEIELSEDPTHPHAQDLRLVEVEVEEIG